MISLFCCLFFLDLLLTGCFFLEISPLLLGCPTLWHITAYKQSLMIFLCLCSISYFFISFTSFLGPLLSLVSLAKDLLILFFQKKKKQKKPQLLVLFNSSIISLFCIIYLLSDLYYFLSSGDFRFCYSNCFGW